MAKLLGKSNVKSTVYDPADDLKNLLEPVLAVSLFTKENVMLTGGVGVGKSEIETYLARQVFGEDAVLTLACTPALSAAKISGHPNPALYIDPSAVQRGAPEYIVDRTPLDPRYRVVILDEWPRLSPLAQAELVHVLHNLNPNRPVFWGTANWTKNDMETEAVRDRMGISILYDAPEMDVEAIMKKDDISTWSFDVPDAATIDEVRKAMRTPTPKKSFEAMRDLMVEINRMARTQTNGITFDVNNRRVKQWQRMLWAAGIFQFGSTEWSTVAPMGLEAIKFAYPVVTKVEALQWSRIIATVSDVVGAAIAEFVANAYTQWQEIIARGNGKRSQSNREEIARVLGGVLSDAQSTLMERWPNDPRATKAVAEMSNWYRKACKGENI